ncbi:hypothetical protein [Streptomyces sp. NPDC012510]|uniref:hypothetical protein n=1 Tax=Streptomyces sp. NPDC012510 TaxID=3364838 RepID=UPI0036E5E305
MTITHRLHRPTQHWGGSHGVTKWEYTRRIGGRTVLFEITHDTATRTTSVRTYPGAGWTPPSHNFTIRGLTIRQITARVHTA